MVHVASSSGDTVDGSPTRILTRPIISQIEVKLGNSLGLVSKHNTHAGK